MCSCVITCRFTEQENYIHNIINLIKQVKKIPHIYIESIYEDNIKSKLLYASKYYLKNVDKLEVEHYNKEKRERSYSDMEIMILNSIIKNHKKESKEETKSKPKPKPKPKSEPISTLYSIQPWKDDSDNKWYKLEPPKDFICPISLDLMIYPVVTNKGYTYDKRNIEEHFTTPLAKVNKNGKIFYKEPNDNTLNDSPRLIPNKILKSMIEYWKGENFLYQKF